MSMSMTYIQLIQQCTLAIWGGGVTLNLYPIGVYNNNKKSCIIHQPKNLMLTHNPSSRNLHTINV